MLYRMLNNEGKHINKKYGFKIIKTAETFEPFGQHVLVTPKNLDGTDIESFSVSARLMTWIFTSNLEAITN